MRRAVFRARSRTISRTMSQRTVSEQSFSGEIMEVTRIFAALVVIHGKPRAR
jgi:hypothetical protein